MYIDTTYMARHYTRQTRVYKEATRHDQRRYLLRTGARALGATYRSHQLAAALIAELEIQARDVPGQIKVLPSNGPSLRNEVGCRGD